MTANAVVEFILATWNLNEIRYLAILIVAAFVFAVAASIRTGEFKLYKLGEFLWKKFIPMFLIYGVIYPISRDNDLRWIPVVVYGMMLVMLAADIAENAKALGIPIPDGWMKYIDKV